MNQILADGKWFLRDTPERLTWQWKNYHAWRCISHWKSWFSIAMLLYSRDIHKVQQFGDPMNLEPWTLMAKVRSCSTNLLYGITPVPKSDSKFAPEKWCLEGDEPLAAFWGKQARPIWQGVFTCCSFYGGRNPKPSTLNPKPLYTHWLVDGW